MKRVLEGRKADMEEVMNHLFDEVPESEAVGQKLIRAKWLNDDRDEKARERRVAMDIAAFEGKRDDNYAMTPPLKVSRILVSNRDFVAIQCRQTVASRSQKNSGFRSSKACD